MCGGRQGRPGAGEGAARVAPASLPAALEAASWKGYLSYVFLQLEHAGWGGFLSLTVAFSIWVCLSLPTTPIEVAAGFVYGPLWGAVCGLLCKTAGSCGALFVARALGQHLGWKLPQALKPWLSALRKRPTLTMVGVRLAPLPLGVKNYGLALCEVSLLPYAVAALLVNAPFSAVWASAGASCRSLSEALSGSKATSTAAMLSKVLAGLAAAALIAGLAWRRLRPAAAEEEVAPADGAGNVSDDDTRVVRCATASRSSSSSSSSAAAASTAAAADDASSLAGAESLDSDAALEADIHASSSMSEEEEKREQDKKNEE